VQSEKGLSSRLHSKVAELALEVYVKLASLEVAILPEGGAGGVLMDVFGPGTSTRCCSVRDPHVQLGSEEEPGGISTPMV